MKKINLTLFGLFIISLIGILIRLFYIIDYPLLHNGDPYIYASDVKGIVSSGFYEGINYNIFPESFNTRPMLFSFLLSVTQVVTNLDILILVKYSVILILLPMIFLIFINSTYLLKKNKTLGALITTFLFVLIPQFVLRTSLTLSENITLLFLLICLFFLIKFHYKRESVFLYLGLFLSVISIAFHFGGIFILLLFLVYGLVNFKDIPNRILLLIVGCLSIFILLISYPHLIQVVTYHVIHSTASPNVFTLDVEPPITYDYYLNMIGPIYLLFMVLGYIYVSKSFFKDKLFKSLLIFSFIILFYFEIYPHINSFLNTSITVVPTRILTYFMLVPTIFFLGIIIVKVIEIITNKRMKFVALFFILILTINPLTWFWSGDITPSEYQGLIWFKENVSSDSFFISAPSMRYKIIFLSDKIWISNFDGFLIEDAIYQLDTMTEVLSILGKNKVYLVLSKNKINSPTGLKWLDSTNLVGAPIDKIRGNNKFTNLYENEDLAIFEILE